MHRRGMPARSCLPYVYMLGTRRHGAHSHIQRHALDELLLEARESTRGSLTARP